MVWEGDVRFEKSYPPPPIFPLIASIRGYFVNPEVYALKRGKETATAPKNWSRGGGSKIFWMGGNP